MALGLTVWLTVVVSDDVAPAVLALGVAGAALTAAAVVWPVLLYLALAVSGSGYGLHLAVDEPPLDVCRPAPGKQQQLTAGATAELSPHAASEGRYGGE